MDRTVYILKRLVLGIPVVLFGLTVTFFVIYLGPINPVSAILGQGATQDEVRRLAVDLGLRYPNGDPVPLWVQYRNFMVDMLTFQFGDSWVINRGQPVVDLIGARMPATIWLGFWSVVVALGFGIPVGLYAGLNSNTWSDYSASAFGIIWRAMPNFWLAVILAGVISAGGPLSFYRDFLIPTDVIGTPNEVYQMVSRNTLPFLNGIPVLERLWIPVPNVYNILAAFKWILPAALVLGSASMGNEVRIGRTAVIESINSKYVDTAKAKGVSTRDIIIKHVGRNALLPLLPVIMGEFYLLIGGSVLVETVFSINGLGNLYFRSAIVSDIPVILALTYIFILILVIFNIVQDIAYTFIDPRIALSDDTE